MHNTHKLLYVGQIDKKNYPMQSPKIADTKKLNWSNLSGCGYILKGHLGETSHPHRAAYLNTLLSHWYTFSAFGLLHKSANIQAKPSQKLRM